MMLCGTPNRKMIDLMKLTVVRAVELVIGTASIHLVNLSTATSRCVLPPFQDFLSGPKMSSPQVANGQDNGMVLSSDAGACGLLANFDKRRGVVQCLPRFSLQLASTTLLKRPWPRVCDCSCDACKCLRGSRVTGLCRLL